MTECGNCNGLNYHLKNNDCANPIRDFTQTDSWRLFRIMAEFVDSFEEMADEGPLITVFGSARTAENDPVYQDAVNVGRLLVKNGYGVITGGGPGIMEAVNKGAKEVGGTSIGLNIELPMEQSANPYLTTCVNFRYFFVRKVNFLKYALGVIVYPGGFGTMDEFFEVLTLVQTKKVAKIPIILVGREFWMPLKQWFVNVLLAEDKISAEDIDFFKIVDDASEAVRTLLNDIGE